MDLKNKRVRYAGEMLSPYLLVPYIAFGPQFQGEDLRDFIEWRQGTDLGDGNVYVDDVLLGRYFKSQEEFIESCTNPRDFDGHVILDGEGHQIRIVRDFDQETDSEQFPLDTEKYSLAKVFLDGSIALAAKTDGDGNFSIDVYPSKDLKVDILQSLIANKQEIINRKQSDIRDIQDRIEGYTRQLSSLS